MSGPPNAQGGGTDRTWTVLELLQWTTDHFAAKGLESPRLDAELLLAHALGLRRLDLYLRYEDLVGEAERARYRELIGQRAGERMPVSLLLGEKEFWSLRFRVTPDVLTPRPESETLVEAALARLPDAEREYTILDLGTGSGALALALAHEKPRARITATDLSGAALEVARGNAEALDLAQGVRFIEGSLFEPVAGEQFDLIVSNPPYLAQSRASALPPELAHEPAEALFGGEDGLAILRPLFAQAHERLAPGGWLIVEVDPDQAKAGMDWAVASGLGQAAAIKDLSGQSRAVVARRGMERA
jgi:release factor glutamine methyltransferase